MAILACLGASFGACTNYSRANGEGCIKDQDCISGLCLAQVCSSPAPTLNGTGSEDGGGGDTGTEAGTSSETGGPTPDSSTGDAGKDGPAPPPQDSGHDATDSSSALDATDASLDLDANDGSPDLDGNLDAGDSQLGLNNASCTTQLA